MKKRILIPGTLVVLLLALWLFNRQATGFIDLYTTPRVGSFEVDVTTTGNSGQKFC